MSYSILLACLVLYDITFVTDLECDHLIVWAKVQFQKSIVAVNESRRCIIVLESIALPKLGGKHEHL